MRIANRVIFPTLRREQKTTNVGDLVQWTSGGVDQFETPKRVRRIQNYEGEEWVFVEGTETAVPMNELTIVTPAADAPTTTLSRTTLPDPDEPLPADNEREWLRGPLSAAEPSPTGKERELLRGTLSRDTTYRLIVSGDIGPRELGKLIRLLQAQKAILEDDND